MIEGWTTRSVRLFSNRIYQNNHFGISVDRPDPTHKSKITAQHQSAHSNLTKPPTPAPLITISNNKIFENLFWGINIKGKVRVHVIQNQICSNKCGGIWIGLNYSADLLITKNVISDNSGPPLYDFFREHTGPLVRDVHTPSDEERIHTRAPQFTENCTTRNGELWVPGAKPTPLVEAKCAWCDSSAVGTQCNACHGAYYCGDKCRTLHASRHQPLCQLINRKHRVTVIRANESYTHILVPNPGVPDLSHHLPAPKPGTSFIVKIQTAELEVDSSQLLGLYDKSRKVVCSFRDSSIFQMVQQYGVMGVNQWTSKKLYMAAHLEPSGQLVLHTDELEKPWKW